MALGQGEPSTRIMPKVKYSGHPRFYKLLDEIENLHDRKNANYSKARDPLSNLNFSETYGVKGSLAVMIRMGDKWCRFSELMGGKKDLVGESVKDTLMDLVVYSLLEIIMLEEETKRKKKL